MTQLALTLTPLSVSPSGTLDFWESPVQGPTLPSRLQTNTHSLGGNDSSSCWALLVFPFYLGPVYCRKQTLPNMTFSPFCMIVVIFAGLMIQTVSEPAGFCYPSWGAYENIQCNSEQICLMRPYWGDGKNMTPLLSPSSSTWNFWLKGLRADNKFT